MRRIRSGCCPRAASGRAAECGQQFPPFDGDCHTPLPCEVRKGNDTTPRACCPNPAQTRRGWAHAGHTPQRSAARSTDSGLTSRDLSSAAPLHFVLAWNPGTGRAQASISDASLE